MKAHTKIRLWITSSCYCLGVFLSFFFNKSLAFQVQQQYAHKQSTLSHPKKYHSCPFYTSYKKKTILYDTTTSSSSSLRNKGRRRPPPTIPYITCTSTKEVTRAIETYLRKGDVVAELGSQLRDSSTAICDTIGTTGKAILLDVTRKFPTQERKQQKSMEGKKSTTAMRREGDEIHFYKDRATFIELKGTFDSWRQELFFYRIQTNTTTNTLEIPCYTALVVDIQAIAGNDLDLTSIALVKDFLALNRNQDNDDDDDDDNDRNPCRVVIIKSRSLAQLSQRMISGPRLINGLDSLPFNHNNNNNDSATTFIVGTVGVQEYRRTIPHVIQKGDAVLEIGCHFGTSTALFHQAAKTDNDKGGCIGVDIGPSIIKMANQKYPNVPFVVGDAWHMAALRDMKDSFLTTTTTKSRRIYDVVYVDVGGLSGSDGLLEAISLLSSIQFSLEPRCIIIKSLCIRRLASSLTPFSAIWQSMLNNDNNIENKE